MDNGRLRERLSMRSRVGHTNVIAQNGARRELFLTRAEVHAAPFAL
jgi:hypothetical protein